MDKATLLYSRITSTSTSTSRLLLLLLSPVFTNSVLLLLGALARTLVIHTLTATVLFRLLASSF